jgi:hypothetical protein
MQETCKNLSYIGTKDSKENIEEDWINTRRNMRIEVLDCVNINICYMRTEVL